MRHWRLGRLPITSGTRTIAQSTCAASALHEIADAGRRVRAAQRGHRSFTEHREMTGAMTWAWLLQGSVALGDTIYTKEIQAAPSMFERVAGVASGLLTIAFLVFVVAAVPAMWNFRKSYRRVNHLLERIYGDINPIMRHASNIADNVDYVTTAIRTDIQQLNATIATANQRLQEAIASTEHRLRDMSALLSVVQEEAEQMFVSTASTVRGVRRGASALSRNGGGPKFARHEEDDLESPELDDEADIEEEMIDGDERNASTAEDDAARPRVRPRAGRGRGRPRTAG